MKIGSTYHINRFTAHNIHIPVLGFLFPALCLIFTSCRQDIIFVQPETEQQGDTTKGKLAGFYLLNEGNMGSNKASLDYYDFATATYTRNIYQAANPTVTQSLGDVGNDIAIYGNRLYAVINCSNLIEVMDAYTAKHLGTIEVPNCRYLCFDGQYGYVSSYAGPVQMGNKQIGYVAKFDTATLQITDTCYVGYQPDEIEVSGDKIYVANSGGYLAPDYENKLTVIDINTFKSVGEIIVAVNLHRVRADRRGNLWVTSRGDYGEHPAKLYCVDPEAGKPVDSIEVAVGSMFMHGDSLYFCGYDEIAQQESYGIVNTLTRKLTDKSFIKDGTTLTKPYGIAVHPDSAYVYLTDAGNYVSPGKLYCFSRDGKQMWNVRTGDIPAHFALLYENKEK